MANCSLIHVNDLNQEGVGPRYFGTVLVASRQDKVALTVLSDVSKEKVTCSEQIMRKSFELLKRTFTSAGSSLLLSHTTAPNL